MTTREHYERGMAAYGQRRYADAVSLLEAAAAREGDPASTLARYYLSRSHHRLACELLQAGRHDQAAAHFTAAGELSPSTTDLPHYLADCYLAQRRFDAASHQLEQALALGHETGETWVRLALAQYQAGDPFRAVATLRQAVRHRPGDAEVHHQLGIVAAAMGELSQAQHHFEAAIARDPSHARALERLAQCCAIQGRHERALRYLERAHQIEPENSRIAWQLTLLAPEEAARILSVAPAARTRIDHRALDRLARIILEEPEFIDAFVALPPTAADPEVFLTLSATLRRTLEKHPGYADLQYRYGLVQQRLACSTQAIAAAERALQINPRYVNALILLAQLYAQTDRAADAVDRIEAAISAGADYPDVHCLMGRLCQRIGSIERARTAYRRALELNDQYQEAREALASLAA